MGQLLFEEIRLNCMNGSGVGDKATNMTKQEKKINLTAQQTFQISTSTALSKLMSLKSFSCIL